MSIKVDIETLWSPSNQFNWYYYPVSAIRHHSFTSPADFIDDLFRYAQKQMLITEDIRGYNGGAHNQFRAIHSVSTYFIGILLSQKIQQIGGFGINYPNLNVSFPFSYLWNLTCLFHDQGYGVECNKQLAREILTAQVPVGYMSKMNISPEDRISHFRMRELRRHLNINSSIWFGPYAGRFHKKAYKDIDGTLISELAGVLRQYYKPRITQIETTNTPLIKIPTFSSRIISRYFNLRLTIDGKCDHGIVGGALFFDLITKNYMQAFQCASQSNSDVRFDNFIHNELHFCKEQIPIFAYIANCIISHNLWEAGCECSRVTAYKEYGLDCLVGEAYPKISALQDPLLFTMAIADTIDPVKIFGRNAEGLGAQRILDSIDLLISNDIIELRINNNLLDFNKYQNEIIHLQDWVAVSISSKPRERIIQIKIN